MKDSNVVSYILSGFTFLTSALTQDIMQIILLILGILSTLFSIAYTIWKWYRKAKADGVITNEEVDELMDELNDKTGNKK